MSNDREWNEWSRLWKQGPEASAGVVPEAALAAARREVRRQVRAAAGEVLGSVALVVFAGWLLARRPPAPVLVLAVLLCAYAGAWLAWFFAVRQGSWRVDAASVAEHLAAARRRRVAALRWARFARACVGAWAAVIAVWAPWVVVTRRGFYAAEPWRAVVGFGVAALILAGVWRWYGRALARARRELDAFEALAQAAEDPPEGPLLQ